MDLFQESLFYLWLRTLVCYSPKNTIIVHSLVCEILSLIVLAFLPQIWSGEVMPTLAQYRVLT